jgi:hypothetical protein
MRKYICVLFIIFCLVMAFSSCTEKESVSFEQSQLAGAVIGSWSWQMSCTIVGSDTTTRESCDCWKMLNFDAGNHFEYYTSETGSMTPALEGSYSVRYEFVDFFGGRTDILRMNGFPCSMKIEIGDNNRLRLSENCNETSMTECAWHVYQRRN